MSDHTLRKDRVALLDFTLAEEDGTLIEGTSGGRLFAYLHGHGNLPEALETVLEGLAEGETFDAVVPQAFGADTGVEPQAVRKKDLPKQVADDPRVGASFGAQGSQGNVVQLWITKVKGAQVWVTTQHPLAGKTVHFRGQVSRVRDATATELEHGHAHGPRGHAH